MIRLILLLKTHGTHQSKLIEKALNKPLAELEVEARVLGTIADGWVEAVFEGEDEKIAANYATKEFGVCPGSIDELEQMTNLRGYITDLERNTECLFVDVGLFQPRVVIASIPLLRLQTQLVQGREISLKRISGMYGFCEDLPIEIRRISLEKNGVIEAQLSDDQLKKLQTWQESLLDRLVILGLTLQDIENVLKSERLERDIVHIESLGLLEHALTCKFGTDAAGLIPRIGRKYRRAKFAVFNPKKLLNL